MKAVIGSKLVMFKVWGEGRMVFLKKDLFVCLVNLILRALGEGLDKVSGRVLFLSTYNILAM